MPNFQTDIFNKNLDTMKNKLELPKDGIAGLKENFSSDAVSGFIVFLLALPLSLGIAKASDFPPIMGLLTAIVGGIVVSIFSGSRLTIKGPAAGLIVIVASAVAEFGKGDNVLGWHLALGAMVVAGLVQILFGVFKLGKLMDFFPLSAVHGMLAAIGLIIIGKQIPVFLHTSVSTKGKGPLELFASIPEFVAHLDPKATIIGVVSLAIMMGWPAIKNPIIKKIPAPLVVLALAIPAELYMNFQTIAPDALVKIGSLVDNIQLNASFEGLNESGIFIKFVIMFALVGSLESLLTVKAMDMLDPYKRKSDANKDLIATGIGNTVVAFLGGLPMISEVARSSANIANGAKTRWANFFHGFFILLFVLIAAKLIELIPNTALAAMLITVGIKLTHPKEFIHTLEKGKEQLLIFLVTIIFTLVEDLLVGIAAGILTEILVNLFNGKPLKAIFSAPTEVSFTDDAYLIEISDAAVFTNYLGIKRKLESIPSGFKVTIDLSKTHLVDHSVMENFEHFKHDYESDGGSVTLVGLENHKALSSHQAAARKRIKA
jgi:MFS superfamily sulfate permease-like transporter